MERESDFNDAELLDASLDGALTPAEAESLALRVARDPELATALERARAARAARQAVWARYDTDDDHAAAVVARSIAAAAHHERVRRATVIARRATGVAAAVLLAFAGGWVARGRLETDINPNISAFPTDNHPFVSTGVGDGPSFPVALTDERGNIIAVQQFDDPGKAKQFAEDVDRWQSRPAAPPRRAAEYVPVSGEF